MIVCTLYCVRCESTVTLTKWKEKNWYAGITEVKREILINKIFNLSSGKMNASNKVATMRPLRLTILIFQTVSYSFTGNEHILIYQLVYGEMNRLLIYFRPLHVPPNTNTQRTLYEKHFAGFYSILFSFFFFLFCFHFSSINVQALKGRCDEKEGEEKEKGNYLWQTK